MSRAPISSARASRPVPVGPPEGAVLDLRPAAPRPASHESQAPAASTPRFSLAWVGLAAALVAAFANLLLGSDPYANPDSRAFESIARSLLSGHGLVYREPMMPGLPLYAFRAPGYSVFLALGLALGGAPFVLALQGALHGLSSALTGDLAGRLAGPRAAWVAFALRFAWPAGWFQAGQFLSEGLFEFAVLLTVWLVVQADERRRLPWALGAGVLASVALYTRPAGLGVLLVMGSWLLGRYPKGAFALALAALVTWVPWPLRNGQRLHAFVPLITSGGATAWCMLSDRPPIESYRYMAAHTSLGEVGLDHHFRSELPAMIPADPLGYARRTGAALLRYVGPIRDRSGDAWLHRFALLALLPGLAWGAWRRRMALPAMVWGGQGLLLVPLAVNARFRFPTEWCVIVAAAIGLEAATVRWGAWRTARWAGGALALCVAFTRLVARG